MKEIQVSAEKLSFVDWEIDCYFYGMAYAVAVDSWLSNT
jgi:hypothetical protein